MTEEHKKQILELTGRKLSPSEFRLKYPYLVSHDYLLNETEIAIKSKDSESIEYLIYMIDFFPSHTKAQILSDLIILPWHSMHESIISHIQQDYPNDFNPDNIFISMNLSYPYMDENDFSNYIRNCIILLKKASFPEAKRVIDSIKNSANPVILKHL
jgi:hypothetical protein